MSKNGFSVRFISCLLVIIFSFSSIAASNSSLSSDVQKKYDTAVELLANIPPAQRDWKLYKDELLDGLDKLLPVVEMFEELEQTMDVKEQLNKAYNLLASYYLCLGNPSEADYYFSKADDSDEYKEKGAKDLSHLECNSKCFICDKEGWGLTEIKSPYVLYLGDLKDDQGFEFYLEIINNGESCRYHTNLEFPGFGFLSYGEVLLEKGDSYSYGLFSYDEPVESAFLPGEYQFYWTVNGYPVAWIDYEVRNGTSKEDQAAHKKSDSSSVYSAGKQPYQDDNTDSASWHKPDLEDLYDEFQKFWYVRDSYDLQDRFEEFLATKNIDPDDIEDYDDFIEVWTETYDEDLDFDDLESYALGLYTPEDRDSDDWDYDDYGYDEYDILVDDDVDILYDDYLDDYIDDYDDYGFYNDYGEYYDEVYYDW